MRNDSNSERNYFWSIVSLAVIGGLTWNAVGGWEGLSQRMGFAWIMALSCAIPFIYFFHRLVKGCWVSGLMMLFFLVILSAEGGLSLSENSKVEGSARRNEKIAHAKANESSSVLKFEEKLKSLETEFDFQSKQIGELEAEKNSIVLLAPGELESLQNEKASLPSQLNELRNERQRGYAGPKYWKGIEAITGKTQTEWNSSIINAESNIEMLIASITRKLDSDFGSRSRITQLEKQIAGLKSEAKNQSARIANAQSQLESAEQKQESEKEIAVSASAIRNTIFEKADHWATDETGVVDSDKATSILFWFGFSLNFIQNFGAGLLLAIASTPNSQLIKILRLKKPETDKDNNETDNSVEVNKIDEEEEPEEEPENVLQFVGEHKKNEKESRPKDDEITATNLEIARDLMNRYGKKLSNKRLQELIVQSCESPYKQGEQVSASTARNYRLRILAERQKKAV